MHAINLIAKHLPRYFGANVEIIKGLNTQCAFTGEPITEGIPINKVLGGTFTDFEYIKFNTGYVSIDAYLCISECLPSSKEGRGNSLRVYSYFADREHFKIFKREEILDYIINQKLTPFVLCVSYNNKKHTAFKAKVNYDNEEYTIRTDLGHVRIFMPDVRACLPIMQNWYTIVPGKGNANMPPTFFSKQEILTGKLDFKKVIEYGEDRAYSENEKLERYRGALWFELIVHCLNKSNAAENKKS